MAGIDPSTGTIPDGIEAQTDQALASLAAVLADAGASMGNRTLAGAERAGGGSGMWRA